MECVMINDHERIDDLQIKQLKIIQHTKKFCFGMDAVLLSDFADVKKGERVLDLGTGTGIIPILLIGKTEAAHITGIEIQQEMAKMANRSVKLNHLSEKIKIIHGDFKKAIQLLGAGTFDVITTNPPYMNAGLKNPEDAKAIARHEIKCTLEDVVKTGSRMLKIGGKFAMVHRPERLVDIICLMRQYKLEPKRLRMVHSYPHKRANLILIEGVRSGKAYLNIMEPLYVRNADGSYTQEIDKIYGKDVN